MPLALGAVVPSLPGGSGSSCGSPSVGSDLHITVKELLPIVLGVTIWGNEWKGLTVSCFCYNAAVVAIVNPAGARWTGPCT